MKDDGDKVKGYVSQYLWRELEPLTILRVVAISDNMRLAVFRVPLSVFGIGRRTAKESRCIEGLGTSF